MLNSEFNDFAKHPEIDLDAENMHKDIEAANEWIYPTINNGVYRCGFAKSQKAYNQAIEELTVSFDRVEEVLSKQRFVAGDRFTLADIRLFVTLLRFDEVYVVYFKTNTRSVANSPAILNYCREIYQMPGVQGTVNMDQIKLHYFASHPDLNHWSIIPKGANFEEKLNLEHNRDAVGSSKKMKV
jgi:putative glutathione S-transferase